jgi:hypothetical protein
MAVKVIRLRYAGTCPGCGGGLPVGTRAWWDADARTTTCLGCRPLPDVEPDASTSTEAVAEGATDEAPDSIATGEAGWSASHEHEKRHQRREHRIERRWGPLAGVVKFATCGASRFA